MAKESFLVEIIFAAETQVIPCAGIIDKCLHRVFEDWDITSTPVSVTSYQSVTMDVYGEYRVADGDIVVTMPLASTITTISDMVSVGPIAVGKPKEHTIDSGGGVGNGVKAGAGTSDGLGANGGNGGIHNDNGKVEPMAVLANQGASDNGAETDVSKEYRERSEDFDTMLSFMRSDLGRDHAKLPMGRSCCRCGADNDLVQTGCATSFYTAGITAKSSYITKCYDLCGVCFDLVFP